MSLVRRILMAVIIGQCIPVAASAFGQGAYVPFGKTGLAVSAGYGGGGGFSGPALGIGLSLLGRVDLGFAYAHQTAPEEPQSNSGSFNRSASAMGPFISVYVAKPKRINSLGVSISASYTRVGAKRTGANYQLGPTRADALSVSGDFWTYAFRSGRLLGVPSFSAGYIVPLSERAFDQPPFSPFASGGLAFIIDSSRSVSVMIEPGVSFDFMSTTVTGSISGGIMIHAPFER